MPPKRVASEAAKATQGRACFEGRCGSAFFGLHVAGPPLYFQTVQIMFGVSYKKHHNSQLQNETSATAVSVVLVECHKTIYASHRASKHSKVYLPQMIFGQSKLQTTICPFTIVPKNRLVHRRYLVKSKLCNVTDLSAPHQEDFHINHQTNVLKHSEKGGAFKK